jgi:hypothetical protein
MLYPSPFLSVLSSRRERGNEMLSTRTTRLLKPFALALALAGLAVPTAQASSWPDRPASQKGHRATAPVTLITEHSAGQNDTGQQSMAESVPLLTEHSAGQNGTSQPSTAAQKDALTSAAASVSAATPNGFKWRDAGIGASVAFAAMLLAIGVATLIMRRGRGRLAGF